jgi:cytochrome o ubiquinol oxidase subunit 2
MVFGGIVLERTLTLIMRRRRRFIILALFVLGTLVLAGWYLHHTNIPLLETRGPIAEKERNLIIFASLLSLVVVIPVFAMAIFIAWRYRESNTKATYSPDFDHSRVAETIWWVVPGILITILSVVAWNSSHTLDPYRPLSSKVTPINVQVVALDWKWLFIYPRQDIASVNLLEFPVNTPVNFEITSDAPMNSFWVPQLSGQIYAMPGMSTQLHFAASSKGDFNGFSSNISGVGFSGMTFIARSTSRSQFNNWIRATRLAPHQLSLAAYKGLSQPSQYNPVSYYSSVEHNLYTTIIAKYLVPSSNQNSAPASDGGMSTMTQGMSGMAM